MVTMRVEDALRACCPAFVAGVLCARVTNSATNAALWAEIDRATAALCAATRIEEANRNPRIAATREAYKRCGKDPNRYRPSAEALRRRVLQGKGLYRASTLVDLVNLASLESGFSIGAFDSRFVTGELTWGIGREGEPYEAIGRGPLNIAGLPVLRDAQGAIGTPTSDSERTRLRADTTDLILVVNAYGGRDGLDAALARLAERLVAHAEATGIETSTVPAAAA